MKQIDQSVSVLITLVDFTTCC